MFTKICDAFRLTLISLGDVLPYSLFVRQRRALYVLAGAKVAADACVYGGQIIAFPQRLSLAPRCFVNARCIFENVANVSIGEDSYIGPAVLFNTTNHEPGTMVAKHAPIVVGRRVWIGGGAILLPGVTVEDDAVIAAGAVLPAGIYSAGLYAGVPAVRHR